MLHALTAHHTLTWRTFVNLMGTFATPVSSMLVWWFMFLLNVNAFSSTKSTSYLHFLYVQLWTCNLNILLFCIHVLCVYMAVLICGIFTWFLTTFDPWHILCKTIATKYISNARKSTCTLLLVKDANYLILAHVSGVTSLILSAWGCDKSISLYFLDF